MDGSVPTASFQTYMNEVLRLERHLSHLADMQWRLVSIARLFEAEHEIAHRHLMTAASSVSQSIVYLENCKWLAQMQFRAALQRHTHRNGGEWPPEVRSQTRST